MVHPAWQFELGRRWAEPHRHHHNLEHLREVLDALDTLADDGFVFDLAMARRGAWFHDAIYDVRRDDNEVRSAELARRILPVSIADRVAQLVLVTGDHVAPDGDAEAAALCDADLSVLGADEERYARYADAIRLEYEHVPEPVFRQRRASILTDLLDHDWLYATEPGRARWEETARDNVRAESAALAPTRPHLGLA